MLLPLLLLLQYHGSHLEYSPNVISLGRFDQLLPADSASPSSIYSSNACQRLGS